jgi:hypothetical protein
MIDLNKFTQETETIVPVLEGTFQFNRKKYSVKNKDQTGWFSVQLQGNKAQIVEPVVVETDISFQELMKKHFIKGYVYNNNIIFQNFDVGKRKAGVEIMAPLLLNGAPTFSSIEAIIWEDRNIYYCQPNYKDSLIYQVKNACEENADIAKLSFMTPELKTLYLFHNIEQHKIQEEQLQIQKAKNLEEFKKTLQGRLILAFNQAGAALVGYTVSGNRITVDWKLNKTGRTLNSVIDATTFSTLEAGFCLSGEDKKHTVTSMVQLAESYEEDRRIHITRSTDDTEEDDD